MRTRWVAAVILCGAGPAHAQSGFEIHGRGFARASQQTLAGVDDSSLSIEAARVEASYRRGALRAVLETELAPEIELRDAFLRVGGSRFGARLGQFKPPVSATELESRWNLPTVERGLVNDVLVGAMGVAGRRPGLQLEWTGGGSLDLEVRAGAFYPSHVFGDRLGEKAFNNLVGRGRTAPARLAARVSASPSGIGIGFFAESRSAEPIPGEARERLWTAGADLGWRKRFDRSAIRIWIDGFTGTNWQDDNPFDGDHATFAAGRAVVAWRRGGLKSGARYLEPYAMIGAVDPDSEIRDDVLSEIAFGLNAGTWNRLRLGVEVQSSRFGRNTPRALGLFSRRLGFPVDRTAVVLQVGLEL